MYRFCLQTTRRRFQAWVQNESVWREFPETRTFPLLREDGTTRGKINKSGNVMDRREFLGSALASSLTAIAARTFSGEGHSIELEHLGASTACLAGYPLLGALESIGRVGFSTVEIIAYSGASHSVGPIPGFAFHEASNRLRELVYEATRRFRHISAHLPFDGLELFSSDVERRQASVEKLLSAIDGLTYLRGELAVVHAGWPERGSSYREIWPRMVATFRMLGDYAGERGIKIGIETLQPDSAREYVQLIHEVDHPSVGATIDTGHIRGAREIELAPHLRDSAEGRERFNDVLNQIVDELGAKAIHVHLSDVRGRDWRDHQAIGTGIIDFPRFFRSLRREDFRGLLVFELEEPQRLSALVSSKKFTETLIRSE